MSLPTFYFTDTHTDTHTTWWGQEKIPSAHKHESSTLPDGGRERNRAREDQRVA